jgi:hypothetical protein
LRRGHVFHEHLVIGQTDCTEGWLLDIG